MSGSASPAGMGTHTRRSLTVKFLFLMVHFDHSQWHVSTQISVAVSPWKAGIASPTVRVQVHVLGYPVVCSFQQPAQFLQWSLASPLKFGCQLGCGLKPEGLDSEHEYVFFHG